jgi:CubicO group peptidase (beta-lactamase class C family)
MAALAALLARAGLPADLPVAVAGIDAAGGMDCAVSGGWPSRGPAAVNDRFYLASLAKQVTGSVLAVLVRTGTIDPDLPVATWLADLPAWGAQVTPRQLAHHVAGLPGAGVLEAALVSDWTDASALQALRQLDVLPTPSGTEYVYSNLGYILLAQLIAEAAKKPFAQVVDERVVRPFDLADFGFVPPAAAMRLPQAPRLGPWLPLSHGDGGLWASAAAFARWLAAQNEDRLGIADLVTAPGRLIDGRRIDYGWGIGLRTFRGVPIFIHGGEWTGAVAKTIRCPSLGIAMVGMAAGGSLAQLSAVVDAGFEMLANG